MEACFVFSIEKKYQLREKIKPAYYALMYLVQDEYPKEYKKMGMEVRDTTNEVLEKTKKLRKVYEKS